MFSATLKYGIGEFYSLLLFTNPAKSSREILMRRQNHSLYFRLKSYAI